MRQGDSSEIFTVSYSWQPEELSIEHGDDSYSMLLSRLSETELLILDGWGLESLRKKMGKLDVIEHLIYKSGSPMRRKAEVFKLARIRTDSTV